MTRKDNTRSPLERTVSIMLLAIGSALPFLIAWFLIASTNDDNPLDNITDFESSQEETLTVPFNAGAAVRTDLRYRGKVRLIIEGTGQAAGTAYSDGFYLYTDADGTPLKTPLLGEFTLEIDGQDATTAMGLADEPLPYRDDHFYTAVYDVGFDLNHIAFRVADPTPDDNTGAYTITVIDIDDLWDH